MEKLKLSAPDWCFYRDEYDPERYYAQLREIGYEAVEMVPPSRRAAAKKAGLKILNLPGPGMEKGLNDKANHPQLLPQLKQAIAEAAQAGIPAVIVFSGARGKLGNQEGLENCAEGLRQILPEAQSAGVDLLFEMLNSHDHKDYQADHSDYGFKLLKAVSSPHLKVLFDIYHMSRMGEDVLPGLLKNREEIAHIHVAEVPERGIPKPDGRIDYGSLAKQFHEAGYQGYWGMEFIPGQEPLKELAQAFQLFQSFLEN
jgi:hydroxypyruvate isomerase